MEGRKGGGRDCVEVATGVEGAGGTSGGGIDGCCAVRALSRPNIRSLRGAEFGRVTSPSTMPAAYSCRIRSSSAFSLARNSSNVAVCVVCDGIGPDGGCTRSGRPADGRSSVMAPRQVGHRAFPLRHQRSMQP